MARMTGGRLAVLIDDTAITATRDWTYDEEDIDVDATAAGDDWELKESLRGRFKLELNALLDIATPYVIPTDVRGTVVTFAGKVDASDTDGLVSGWAKVDRLKIEAAYDQMVKISLSLSTAGIAPTYNLSPA